MINQWDAFAGLERVSILISSVHETLGYYNREDDEEFDLHPCIHTQEAKELLGRISDDLASLYQHMGEQFLHAEEKSNGL